MERGVGYSLQTPMVLPSLPVPRLAQPIGAGIIIPILYIVEAIRLIMHTTEAILGEFLLQRAQTIQTIVGEVRGPGLIGLALITVAHILQ